MGRRKSYGTQLAIDGRGYPVGKRGTPIGKNIGLAACDRWGFIVGNPTDDPYCECRMCRARRWDRLSKDERKKHPELRP